MRAFSLNLVESEHLKCESVLVESEHLKCESVLVESEHLKWESVLVASEDLLEIVRSIKSSQQSDRLPGTHLDLGTLLI